MLRCVGPLALVLALVGIAGVGAAQGDVWFYQGGEPGVDVVIEGVSVSTALRPATAIDVDPAQPVNLSISIAPPPGETWRVGSVTVGLLVNGPGSEPPSALLRTSNATATIPSGFTVVVNRSVPLESLQGVGAGTFLMQAEVIGEDGDELHSKIFYVHVDPGLLESLLTVQGAALTAVSVATGYGAWQVLKDLKELRDAWARHRKKQQMAKLDVVGRTEHLAEEVVAKAGKPLAGAVGIHRAAQDAERSLGPARWAATGLGLGGVSLAWLQFLGYVALDATGLVVTAMEICAAFLTVALVANALLRRAWRKAAVEEPQVAPEGPTVTLVPEDGSARRVEMSEAVQPADKRG